MARRTAAEVVEETVEETPNERPKRLVLVFEGKYAPVYDAILQHAEDEDRDPDTVVFRILAAQLLQLPQNAAQQGIQI